MSIERLINRDIKELDYNFIEMGSEKGQKTYCASDINGTFLSKPIEIIIVNTDSKDKIETVSTDFNSIMDSHFYNLIIDKYGHPDKMLKSSGLDDKENPEIVEGGISSKSTTGSLKECSFEDRPMFIIWNEQNFKMVFIMQYQLNRTELVISKTH